MVFLPHPPTEVFLKGSFGTWCIINIKGTVNTLVSFSELQLFQTVQAQTHFEILLPSEKTCSTDYAGLLQAFQIFVLDELKALGFCHIQVFSFSYCVWVKKVCSILCSGCEKVETKKYGVLCITHSQLITDLKFFSDHLESEFFHQLPRLCQCFRLSAVEEWARLRSDSCTIN